MSTAFIFKHLLDVLKIESNLDGESAVEIGKEWLPQLVQSCAALRDASMGKETTNKDRLVILPKVLKCFSRLLNKAISIPLSEIKHPKLVETILEGTFNLLSTLNQADKETRALLQKAMIDEQSSVLMIFLHLITIFEAIGKKNSGSEFEDEHLTEISLQLYNAILVSVYTISDDIVLIEHFAKVEKHKLNHVFSGALATQTIQSLLTFCNHKSKRISTEAATGLLYTLRCFKQHREVWRTCFPGAFSGLFVLTQSGYKSGSGLLNRVLSALLELTYTVTEDSVPENVQLLTYLYTQTISSGDEVATAAIISSALFTNMLQKANIHAADPLSPVATPSTTRVQATDPCLCIAKEFRSVSEYVQWRVQVLQRIQLPLAAAFREVMKLCSPLLRVKLVTQLGTLLSHCSAMLGSLCVSECLCELLNTMLDTTPIVRDTTHSVWRSVQSSIKSNVYATSEYSKILDALGRKYFNLVGTLSSNIKLCQEVRIKDQLGAVLGIGYGIHDHIVNIVRLHASGGAINTSNSTSSNSSSIIKCISTLHMPDPAVCGVRVTASVLETRNYTYYSNEDICATIAKTADCSQVHSVESGYYRVAWKHVQDNICKEYADRWALYLGRYGLLEDIMASTSKQIDKYLKCTASGSNRDDTNIGGTGITEGANPTSSSASLRAHHTAGVVGCLRLLSTALLGLAPAQSAVVVIVDEANNSSIGEAKTTARARLPPVEVCGHCGRSSKSSINNTATAASASTTTKMLRCSRCKAVHYCSKQHQALDWPTHKLTCKTAEAPPAPAANPTTAVPTMATTEQAVTADVNIPTELLTNPNIRITPSTPHTTASVLCVYSAAKRDYLIQRSVLLLLNVMQDYLFNRNNTITTNPITSRVPTTHVLVVAAAVEGIANIAFSAGPDGFQKYLMKLLYPLLELLVDTDPIVKQAAKCTLQRIALYTEQTSLSGLIKHNLDYIVDKICLQLRSPASSTKYSASNSGGSLDGNNASTHLIVDFVFSTLDSTVQDSSEGSNYRKSEADAELAAPMYLLRDVICDSLQSIDAYCLHSVYSTMQLTALLRVLRVLACRAAAAPSVREFVSGGTESNKSAGDLIHTNSNSALLRVSKHLQDKIFQKSTATPIMSTIDTTTLTPTAASLAAQSLLDFTRNLYNLNFEDSHDTDLGDTDPSADLLNTERIRAEQDRQNEQNIAEEHEQDINSTAPPTASVQLLLDVVHRCCVFLTLQHASSQVIVIETLCAAFVRLSVHNGQYQQHLLPCIHSTWPVVINRIHELVAVLQSTEAQAVHSTLSTVQRGAGAGAKVKNGSSALLGLENSLSHVGLSNPVSAGLTAISSASTRSVSSLNTHSTSNMNASSSSATPSTDQRAQLHVLPHVFDLVAILTVAGREFMTIKLKQELLPELYALLVFYLQQSIHNSEGHVNSKKSSNIGGVKSILDVTPTKVFSRSQLLITSADNNKTVTATTNDRDVNTSSKAHDVTRSNTDRFSLHSKIKLSLLGLLTQFCAATTTDVQIVRYVTTQVVPLVYLTLPLMGAQECEEVREAAHGLLTLLHKLDSAGTNTILRSILDSKTSPTEKDDVESVQAMQTWRALHFTPSIVTAFNASGTSTSSRSSDPVGVNSDIVLTMYHCDESLMKELKDILSAKQSKPRNEGNGSGSANCLWIQKLSLWSTI